MDPMAPTAPSGRLQEVAPPGAVQQLQTALAAHHPQLQLTSPADGTVLQPNQQTLVLQVSDWPLAQDPEFGLGAHVALQIDDQPPLRFSEAHPTPGAHSGKPPFHRLCGHALGRSGENPWSQFAMAF